MENQLKILNNIAKQLKAKSDIRAKNIDNLLNWKKIKGRYNNYSVSNRGEVRYDERERILKGVVDGDGYLQVTLYNDGTHCTFKIHRLVANAFLTNPQKKENVDHKDNNRKNNNIDNLRWATDK
jgi:hypothetical protein